MTRIVGDDWGRLAYKCLDFLVVVVVVVAAVVVAAGLPILHLNQPCRGNDRLD